MLRRPPRSTLFPTRRSSDLDERPIGPHAELAAEHDVESLRPGTAGLDRKSTRLNSSHVAISYAVFCLKKKNIGRRRGGVWARRGHRARERRTAASGGGLCTR